MSYDPTSFTDRVRLAEQIRQLLLEEGWEKRSIPGVKEEVYIKFESSLVQAWVYTSIVNGEVRDVAKDAIRCTLIYIRKDGVRRGLVKETRINRTGTIDSILSRLQERSRSVVEKRDDIEPCRDCGTPMFLSKKGKWVCAEICWEDKARSRPVAPQCSFCGADMLRSKKGKMYCSALCWKKGDKTKEAASLTMVAAEVLSSAPGSVSTRLVVVEEHYFRSFKVVAGSDEEALAAYKAGKGREVSFEKVFEVDDEEVVIKRH